MAADRSTISLVLPGMLVLIFNPSAKLSDKVLFRVRLDFIFSSISVLEPVFKPLIRQSHQNHVVGKHTYLRKSCSMKRPYLDWYVTYNKIGLIY